MGSNYKKLGDYIRLVDERNKDRHVTTLLGVTVNKQFIPSVANIIGTDMEKYKIIRKGQYACSLMQVRRDKKIPIALLRKFDKAIISQAYPVFEIKGHNELLPEYLMMWFSRSEFDREACFHAVGGVRGSLEWEDFCNLKLPIPTIEKQREIVKEYNTIVNRIQLNEQLNQKLEESAQAIYKHWFVDFEFPDENGRPYKSSGGEMVWCEELGKDVPEGWKVGTLDEVTNIIMGQSPKGDSYNFQKNGIPLVNGPVEFGEYFAKKSKWTTKSTKLSKVGDLLVCVRGSTVGRFVKSDEIYCLGRGVCSLRATKSQKFVDQLFKFILDELLTFTTGSTFPNLDRPTISNYPIIIALNSVVEHYEKVASKIIKCREESSKESIVLNNLKELLLSKMTKVESKEEVLL